MKKYFLVVWCSRGGMSRDAGVHGRDEFASDQEAITELMRQAHWLLNFYDRVRCEICTNEEDPRATTIYSKTICGKQSREEPNGYLHQVFM